MRRHIHRAGEQKVERWHSADRNLNRPDPHITNSPDEIFGEIGLVLVMVLGIVLAINLVLVGLHIN